jgi:hypothetical protein
MPTPRGLGAGSRLVARPTELVLVGKRIPHAPPPAPERVARVRVRSRTLVDQEQIHCAAHRLRARNPVPLTHGGQGGELFIGQIHNRSHALITYNVII